MAQRDKKPPQALYGGLTPQKGGRPVYFDCTLHQVVKRVSEVTESPIEDGSDVVDHVIHRPIEIDLEIILYGTGFLGQESAEVRLTSLDEIRKSGGLLTLQVSTLDDATSALKAESDDVTSKFIDTSGDSGTAFNSTQSRNQFKSYENMVVTNMIVTDTPDIGIVTESIRLSLSLKQVKIVKSLQSTVTPDKYKKRLKTGRKSEKSVSDSLYKKSLDNVVKLSRNLGDKLAKSQKLAKQKAAQELNEKKLRNSGRVITPSAVQPLHSFTLF